VFLGRPLYEVFLDVMNIERLLQVFVRTANVKFDQNHSKPSSVNEALTYVSFNFLEISETSLRKYFGHNGCFNHLL
jgi:hypothetical protein